MLPLYQPIFLKECNFMSKGAMETVSEYGDYFFSKEGFYLRMYGGSRDPSLLPRYTTYYVIHKEVVRQLYIDGLRNFLYDMKKSIYPSLPFCIGSYKFNKVKSAPDFVRDP